MVLNSMTSTEVPEEVAIKLLAIVSDQYLSQAKSADDVLPDKALDLQGGDGGKYLCLSPLGEVVDSYHYILCLSLAFRKRTNNVNTPLRKGPRAANMSHQLYWEMLYICEPLALIAFLDQFFCIL